MRYLFFILLAISTMASSQPIEHPSVEDPFNRIIDKDIFRVFTTITLDARLRLAASYEHEIKKPFTLVFKAGPSIGKDHVATDAFHNEIFAFTFSAFFSGEIRYYYNLNHRIKMKKRTRNFSACYFSAEAFAKRRLFILTNKITGEKVSGKFDGYLNIGYQSQFNHTYFNAYFGTNLDPRIYTNNIDVFDIIQGGLTIGRAFN